MGQHDQRILKFLAENAKRAPTITDMMKRLGMEVADISSTLDALLAEGKVTKRINNDGIECWFPAQLTPVGGADAPPAEPSKASPSFSPRPRGAGRWIFLAGLFAAGAVAAWIGGRILIRGAVNGAAREMVEKEMFNEAIRSWNEFESRTQTRDASVEAKLRGLNSALDSIRAANRALEAKVQGQSATLDSMKAAQAKTGKGEKSAAKKPAAKRSRR